jgi:hypothetical protein
LRSEIIELKEKRIIQSTVHSPRNFFKNKLYLKFIIAFTVRCHVKWNYLHLVFESYLDEIANMKFINNQKKDRN